MIDEVKTLRAENAVLRAKLKGESEALTTLLKEYDQDTKKLKEALAATPAAEPCPEPPPGFAETLEKVQGMGCGNIATQRIPVPPSEPAAPAPRTDGCFHGDKAHPCALPRVQELESALRKIRMVINEALKEEV